MTDMIEKVAKAILAATERQRVAFMGGHEHPFEHYSETVQENYREQAQAAIEAMREPTENMVFHGSEAIDYAEADGYNADNWKVEAKEAYQAMIGAALSTRAKASA